MHLPHPDQVRDPSGQDARLARAGAGHHQHGSSGVDDGFPLGRVEIGQQLRLRHLGPLRTDATRVRRFGLGGSGVHA